MPCLSLMRLASDAPFVRVLCFSRAGQRVWATQSDAFAKVVGRGPVYAEDPEQLLGGLVPGGPPQLTPIVARNGNVQAVLVELAVDSRLVLKMAEAVTRWRPPVP